MSDYLEQQHKSTALKIVALLERLSTAVKAVHQEIATEEKLTPIQMEVLTYLFVHADSSVSIRDVVSQFQVAQSTMSDVVRILSEKKLITIESSGTDARMKLLSLSNIGKRVAARILTHNRKLLNAVESISENDRLLLYENLLQVAYAFRIRNLITVDKMCLTCRFFEISSKEPREYRCRLLNVALDLRSLRVDCPEHEPKAIGV